MRVNIKINSFTIKKFALLLFCNFLFASILCAQNSDKNEDVIYFKNGNIIRGKIVEQIPEKYLRVEMHDGTLNMYDMKDIQRIAKEESTAPKPIAAPVEPEKEVEVLFKEEKWDYSKTRTKGYSTVFENGFHANSEEGPGGTVQFIPGYKWNNWLQTGLGFGFTSFQNQIFFPLYLDVRGSPFKSRVSPFYVGSIGYAWPLDPINLGFNEVKWEGGPLFNVGLGIKIAIAKSFAFHYAFTYKNQIASRKLTDWNGSSIEYYSFSRIGFMIGISF